MSETLTNTQAQSVSLGGGPRVRRIGYGAMRLSDGPGPTPASPAEAPIWWGPKDRAGAIALLRRAVELGVELIDTADAYALGANEELIAEALHPYPENVVVATKVGMTRPGTTEWVPLGHPAYLRQQVELSLRRLRTERVELLHLHRIDPEVPLADQVGTLLRLQEEGKIHHIGLSEVSVEQLREAMGVAPIASVQNMYNLVTRQHEEVVDFTTEHGIAFLPFFPLALGEHGKPDGPVAAVAREVGATPAQTALAWLLHRSPTTLPIPGTTSVEHVAENLAALQMDLSADQFARLSALGGQQT